MLSLGEMYLLATMAVTALCWLAKVLDAEANEVFTAALVVLFMSCVTSLARTYIGHPYSMAVHPVEDVLCLILFLGAYLTNRSRWAAALIVIFMAQLVIHSGFWIAGDISTHAQRAYVVQINSLFILTLVTLTAAGGGYVVRYCRGVGSLLGRRGLVRVPSVR